MKRIYNYLKKDAVLTISWVLAIVSMFFIKPDKAYAGYIDWRLLGILWSLMIITKGYMQNGIFEKIGHALLTRTRKMWQLIAVLVGLNFFSSMIITNDVSLITFVPFAIMMLKQCGRQELMIPVVVLQTIAANLGSMLTPIGNPQNLYLYGLAGKGIGGFIMWLLPYTIVSALLLVISILLIKNKNEIICIEDTDSEAAHNTSVPRVMAYSVLFILALLVVARVLTWYILAAAGIHPICPGETRYELTSPAFGKVTFRLEDGKTFSIVAKNNSKKNIYIQRAWLNDKEYNQCFIDHADIAKGGTLTLEMGPEPMKSWGTGAE